MAAKLGEFLQQIGISGWNHLEPVILAALKTRTPINLIGDKGTSKTEFCYRISRALQGKKCNFQKYDTPDVTLDQILGLPDLKKMESGEVGFVKTGTAIWNKTAVLWDELNRVNPMWQGKLLEVTRTGKVHGLDTAVEFQFGTCNPPRALSNSVGHDTYYLGDAMASRFFHVHVPKTSVALFDAAMSLAPVREAFDTDNTEAIGKHCHDLFSFWIEYAREKPSAHEMTLAQQMVRLTLAETTKQSFNFFDMRAAIRSVSMLAELFCLNRISNNQLGQNIFPAIQLVICGNIAELNGIIRNDMTKERPALEQKIAMDAQSCLKSTMTQVTLNLTSTPFTLLRSRKLDNASLEPLRKQVASDLTQDNIETVLSSFVKKVQVGPEFQSVAFRASHKFALELFLSMAKSAGFTSLNIKGFPDDKTKQTPVTAVDLVTMGTKDAAETIHKQWYMACGLGTPKT